MPPPVTPPATPPPGPGRAGLTWAMARLLVAGAALALVFFAELRPEVGALPVFFSLPIFVVAAFALDRGRLG